MPTATAYFNDLRHDMLAHNILDPDQFNPRTYTGILTWMEWTRPVFTELYQPAHTRGKQMRTELGHRLSMARAYTFPTLPGNRHCCETSEIRLIASIQAHNVFDPDTQSPVIVTSGETPIGFIKSIGYQTLYGLGIDATRGVIDGAFSRTYLAFEYDNLPAVPYAWKIDADHFGTSAPIRFSTLNMPKEVRHGLETPPDMQTVNAYDHQDIVRIAACMLEHARPIPENMVARTS